MTKWMVRYAKREGINHEALLEAVQRAECGLIDADLGGGLIKQRVAREGQGRSGGHRTIIAYKRAGRAVFLLGFAKSMQANISRDDIAELRKIGSNWLQASEDLITEAIDQGKLEEVTL